MNILVIEPHPEFGGGMEGFVLNASRELARRDHGIVLAYQDAGTMLDAYRQFSASTIQLDLPGFPMRQPVRTTRQLVRLAQLIKKERIEAIFSSHLGFLRVAAALRVMTGVKAWFHLGLPAMNPALSTRLALKFLGGGISPAPHTRETWAQAGWPTRRLHEVRNFVDPATFCPADDKKVLRARLGLPSSSPLIGFIGRIVPEKGVETLVEAFNMVAMQAPDANLLIMGRGDPGYIETVAKRCSYPDRLDVLPPNPRTQDYFAAIDVACVPSEWAEPFPLVMGEAMASGLPVICSNVGVLPEILGPDNQDLVTPVGDCQALSAALLRVVSLDDLGAARGKALRDRAIQLFGPKDVVDAYEILMTKQVAG